jgi:hypothetical protein
MTKKKINISQPSTYKINMGHDSATFFTAQKSGVLRKRLSDDHKPKMSSRSQQHF